MATKPIPMGNPPNQIQIDGFPHLDWVWVWVSPILKHGYGTSNRDICIHPEPIPKLRM